MSDNRTKESELVGSTSMTISDFVRIVVSDASRKITLKLLLDSSKTYLESIGFITTTTQSGGLYDSLSVKQFAVDHIIDFATEAVILMDLTAGVDRTVTLPAMVDAWDSSNLIGQPFSVKIAIPNGVTKVVVATQGSDLIDGNVSISLTGPTNVSAQFVPDGTDWWILGG